MKQSFQAGVDTIYNKIVSCGQTPSDKSPTGIVNSIDPLLNKYRTQGQQDVINNPNNYGLYNKTQYDQNYTNGYNTGKQEGIDYGMIGQTFHVVSQVSGWAAMSLPVPPIATQISCYTNKVNANACSVGSNGSYDSIGIINRDSSNPDIFSIKDYDTISVRCNGAAVHAYVTFLE